MRTLRSLLPILGLILISGQVHAADPLTADPSTFSGNSVAMEHALQFQINKHIIYPLDDEGAMCGVVDVDLVVNTEGHVVVLGARSENRKLCEYVIEKLGRIHVGLNPSGLWNTTHLRFTFRNEA